MLIRISLQCFEVVTNMLRTSSPLTFYIIMPHTHMQKLAVFTGPAETKLNWSGRVRDCVRKHTAARGCPSGTWSPRKIFFHIFEAIFGSFFSLICSSWQAGF